MPLAAAIDAPRHDLATADAGTVSYYADASTGGRPLVLVHGVHAAASSYDVRPMFETFRGRRPVYALDLPGFGFSERSARAYTPAMYVHAIEHLLRNVAPLGGADVVALGLSCEYAAQVAVEMPDLVRSFVMISPTGFAAERVFGRVARRVRALPREHTAKLAMLPWGRLVYAPLVSWLSLRQLLRGSFEQRVDAGLLSYAYATSHQPGAWRAPTAWLSGALLPEREPRQVYGRVRAPVLVLYDHDPYTSFELLPAFLRERPNYQARRISHTRGLPQFEAPEQTAEALRSFFQGVSQPRLGLMLGERLHTTRFIGSA